MSKVWRLFTGWCFEQCLEFNATAYPDDSFAVEKIYRAIRPQFSFDSTFYAVLLRWRFIGLRIFYEIVALEIRYHSKSIATPPLHNASSNVLDGSVSNVASRGDLEQSPAVAHSRPATLFDR
jgi:hypothetical protein